MPGERQRGTVKWFSAPKGYGFIDANGQDVFVHYSSIQSDGYRALKEGQLVEFSLINGSKGLQAEQVIIIEEGGTGSTDNE